MMDELYQEIPLVIAFTRNYFVAAAVSLQSVLKSTKPTDRFHVICLLNEALPEEMVMQLEELNADRLRFSLINLQGALNDIYIDEKYTVAASYRLLLPDLLPEYNRVIYMDCDIIIRNDIAGLFRETKLDGYYVAGVFEATLPFQREYMDAIGCKPGTYINSGFMLMNLELMRKDNMVPQFLEAAKANHLVFPDQDVLNQLCKGKILGLPPFFNGIRTFFIPRYKAEFLTYYSEEDWNAVQRHGTVHYTGNKPWNTFTVKFEVWWRQYDLLPVGLKGYHQVDSDMLKLYRIYATRPGKLLINGLQHIYRVLKYMKR